MNAAALLALASAIFCGVLAFLTMWREKRSVVHLSFVAGLLTLAAESIFRSLSWSAAGIQETVGWQHAGLVATALLPGLWLFFSLGYSRGNYLEFLKRWQFSLLAAFLVPIILVVFAADELFSVPRQTETGQWTLALGLAGYLFTLLFLIGMVLALVNLERTYRAAVGTMRWRIKFMVLGLGVIFAVRFCTSSQTLLSHTIDTRFQVVDAGALFIGCLLMLRSQFRAGHFDLDVYPSRSLLQNSLTVLLAGIYLLVIGILARVISWLGAGNGVFALKAFVLLTAAVLLALLLLSDRVRLRTSRFVSRHFQRPLYDYRTVWRQFTETTASCVKPADFCQAAVKSVTDIFQALSVTIWLVDEKNEQTVFGASTFLSEARAESLQPEKTDVAALIKFFLHHREPVDIDVLKETWAAGLQHCHPDEFHKGGNRVCVPMIVGDEILGFMILGDRVSGVAFGWQDFDLLKCIGDQIAAGLLNTRLSQKLLQAKELEAFQIMSAFFVHDLKNTANTLNLMLQNLPVHFDDPAFRADALRGVAKTVAHINRLIGRLGSIRHELQIKPVPADLNELIARALADWEDVAGINLKKDFQPLPKIFFDPEQMLKVATNLIFNAREAVAQSSGQVQIQTSQTNGWAVLAIADNGCGMSREFMERSLFRPFQTTKKSGLGIGMFQSKMIVEAHKGKIEVESETGKGTTFRIFLPLTNS
jgi:putative PEP-CTERM system histidine kinase